MDSWLIRATCKNSPIFTMNSMKLARRPSWATRMPPIWPMLIQVFWDVVEPFIAEAVEYLQLTQEGKQWIAILHSHVFSMEHNQYAFGPLR